MKYRWDGEQFVSKEDGTAMEVPDIIAAPRIQSDYQAYYSHGSGKMIEGRAARREDLKRTGCREMDPSEGPKTCSSEKWAKKLGLEHDPKAARPKHWADWQTSKRIET